MEVLENIKVKNIIIGYQFEKNENLENFFKLVNEKKIKVKIVKANEKIFMENNLYFDILWTDTNKKIEENVINNNALVCKLNYIDFSMLFTGDIEEAAEKVLANKYKEEYILKSNVLKIAHHGSKSSTTQEFLELVEPNICLIGVGKNNKYGHPNEEVIDRLKKYNLKIYRTDQDGEICLIINKKGGIKIRKLIE